MTLDGTFALKACSYIAFFRVDICAFGVGLSSGAIVAVLCNHTTVSLHSLLLTMVVLTDMVVETLYTRYLALLLLGFTSTWNLMTLSL